jgi:hypothetical protein
MENKMRHEMEGKQEPKLERELDTDMNIYTTTVCQSSQRGGKAEIGSKIDRYQ